jgi:hypothetical protein
MISRRCLLARGLRIGAVGAVLGGRRAVRTHAMTDSATSGTPGLHERRPRFGTRGIILCRRDLEQPDWPDLFARARLNTLGIHLMTVAEFAGYAASPEGSAVLKRFQTAGVAVEFEHHIMGELLPRALFDQVPEMFRVDETGKRTSKANFCCSSDQALKTIRRNAERLARALPHRTGRYFFWPDDAAEWCRCPKCRGLTPSDQNLILANAILEGVRRFDPKATACCLAYAQTLPVPRSVKPAEGIFLEFAPIHRSWRRPFNDPRCEENLKHVRYMEGLLKFFGTKGAQVLEYWLDASRHSGWKRPSKKIPDLSACLEPDMAFYAKAGFESVTTFGVYLDPDYWQMHGPPPIAEYARAAWGDGA